MPQSPAAETVRLRPAARCAVVRRETVEAFAPEIHRDQSTGLMLQTPTLLARATALHLRPALGVWGQRHHPAAARNLQDDNTWRRPWSLVDGGNRGHLVGGCRLL